MIPTIFRLIASGASVACPTDQGVSGSCDTGLPKVNASNTQVQEVLTIFFGIAAAISVLMIVIGAIMFVTSGGNPENANKARETIIYSVIGLVVSLSAVGIVAFIVGKV